MITSGYTESLKKWNCFAATDTLGSFDFRTTIVSLHSLCGADIETCSQSICNFSQERKSDPNALLANSSYMDITKVYPLAAHEYTHFLDTTSTLWGLKHLLLMKEAYESNDQFGGNEKCFYKAKLFYDHNRRLSLPRYYTLVNSNAANTKPWPYQHTAGRVFDGKGGISDLSVVFTRFSNSNGDFLVRSPISMVSLLEMSAMSQEVLMHLYYLGLTDAEFRDVEANLYSHSLMDYLYNPNITEYSVCVHLVANKLQLQDPQSAFRVCSRLSHLILNMPEKYFDKLAKPTLIADIMNISKDCEFVERLLSGLRLRDYGALFFIICSALSSDDWNERQPVDSLIRSTVEGLGISMHEIQSESQSEALRLSQEIGSSIFSEISILAEACYANYNNTSHHSPITPFESLNLPPVLLSDLSSSLVFHNSANSLAHFDIEAAYESLCCRGHEWVERFAEACL
jgi:hypothetical protein